MAQTERLNVHQLLRAAELLKKGELVAFPTETVYGLGASIFIPEAIQQIFKVKGRPSDNPLIAHISSVEQVHRIAQDIPLAFYRLAEEFFPGPLAVVLKRRSNVPAIVSAGLDTIAVRMPFHPAAHQLISLIDTPLVAPSANLSGKPSATQAEHVLEDFEGMISAVVDGGKTEIGIESTVISLVSESPVLLRPGAISKEALERVLARSVVVASTQIKGPILSPGMKYRHYCPSTPIKLFRSLEELQAYLSTRLVSQRIMLMTAQPLPGTIPNLDQFTLCSKEFYSLLRLADRDRYDEIILLCDEEIQKQGGLMNRVLRASGNI